MDNAALHDPHGWQIVQRPLSEQVKLLCIGPQEPSWVNLTLQLDAEGCHQPHFRWVASGALAVQLLRSESFDCILVCGETAQAGQPSAQQSVSPMLLVDALRSGGCETPVVVIASRATDREWEETLRLHCELLVTPSRWDSPVLIRMIKRAMERSELLREHHRLTIDQRRRLQRDREEAEQMLRQQRSMVEDLLGAAPRPREAPPQFATTFDGESAPAPVPSLAEGGVAPDAAILPPEFDRYYQELLRTYVIMGSGSLGEDVKGFAEILAAANIPPQQALGFHLQRVETLVRGLGQRSSRHVMDRADLLVLELLIHLGECYQRKANGR